MADSQVSIAFCREMLLSLRGRDRTAGGVTVLTQAGRRRWGVFCEFRGSVIEDFHGSPRIFNH